MASQQYPATADAFTAEWLNDALADQLQGYRVINSRAVPGAAPGQTAEIIDIKLDYGAPAGAGSGAQCPLPARMIAKVTSQNPDIHNLINSFDQYRREVAFYRELPDVGISTPRCFIARHDPATQRVLLLLEHLAPAESMSWAVLPLQVEEAAAHLAPFHAQWWNNDDLRQRDWLVQNNDVGFWAAAAAGANGAAPAIHQHIGADAETTIEVMARYAERLPAVMKFVASRPFTLVHGDYHGKQMFFPTAAGGRFSVIDWQFSFAAQGAWDLARILALGLTTQLRQSRQGMLVQRYHAGLVRHGVENYSTEELATDLRMGALVSSMIMAVAIAQTDPMLIKAECDALQMDWKDLFIVRGDRMLQDLAVLEFITSIS